MTCEKYLGCYHNLVPQHKKWSDALTLGTQGTSGSCEREERLLCGHCVNWVSNHEGSYM